jgi:hypothetical protein
MAKNTNMIDTNNYDLHIALSALQAQNDRVGCKTLVFGQMKTNDSRAFRTAGPKAGDSRF